MLINFMIAITESGVSFNSPLVYSVGISSEVKEPIGGKTDPVPLLVALIGCNCYVGWY
jgi:hypothetical protein